ncbi:hypothetical protein KMI_25g20150 [Encephalitozoon hellem]|nr:hypothetical protein KMI_25g20150 [Encephalitozoon hellem]
MVYFVVIFCSSKQAMDGGLIFGCVMCVGVQARGMVDDFGSDGLIMVIDVKGVGLCYCVTMEGLKLFFECG